jgi:hypothetical protein
MRCSYCYRAATVIMRYRVHVWTRGWKIGKTGTCSEHESCVGWRSLVALRPDAEIIRTNKAA